MADLPIKGQEVLFTLTGPKGVETIDHIKDASFTFDMETIQEQYLGQVADQFDDIFRGVTVELTFDCSSPKVYDFVQRAIDRAQRRTAANEKFSVISALKFPNGQRRRLCFKDLKFGEIPTGIGGRDEYAEIKLTLKGSSFTKL